MKCRSFWYDYLDQWTVGILIIQEQLYTQLQLEGIV